MKYIILISLMVFMIVSCSGGPDKGGSSSSSSSSGGSGIKIAVSGKLKIGSVSASITKDYNLGGTTNVTHVMAVSPVDGSKTVSAVAADGSFNLNVDVSKPWIIVFLDNTKVGTNMIIASYHSADLGLHSLPLMADSTSVSMGDVSIDPTNKAASEQAGTGGSVLSSIGLSPGDASYWSKVDDVCLRYINPDVDEDGMVDALQTNAFFIQEFHLRFTPMVNSQPTNYTVLKNHFYDELDSHYTYMNAGTGIRLYVPAGFNPGITMSSVPILTLPDSSQISTPDIVTNGLNNNLVFDYEFSDFTNSDRALHYDGTYVYDFSPAPKLTFIKIKTSSTVFDTNFIAISIRINTDSGDVITNVNFKWIIWDGGSWTSPTIDQLDMATVASTSGSSGTRGNCMFHFTNGTSQFGFPVDQVSGSISQTLCNPDGRKFSEFDFNGPIGLSYDDKRGMRFFF
jgi:hypothetical protein